MSECLHDLTEAQLLIIDDMPANPGVRRQGLESVDPGAPVGPMNPAAWQANRPRQDPGSSPHRCSRCSRR